MTMMASMPEGQFKQKKKATKKKKEKNYASLILSCMDT